MLVPSFVSPCTLPSPPLARGGCGLAKGAGSEIPSALARNLVRSPMRLTPSSFSWASSSAASASLSMPSCHAKYQATSVRTLAIGDGEQIGPRE